MLSALRLFRLLSIRSLRVHFLRTVLSTFGIVLGVASILSIGVTNLAALDSVSRLFQNTSGKANLSVISSENNGKGLPESLLRRVAGFPGVEQAAPTIEGQVVLADQSPATGIGLSFFGAGVQGGLALLGVDPAVDQFVRSYRMVSGTFLTGMADEIILVTNYASEKKIKIGDRLDLLTPTGVRRLRVAGLMAKEGPGQMNNGAVGVLSLETAQKILDRSGYVDRIEIVAGGKTDRLETIENLKNNLSSRLGTSYSVIYPASQGKRMTQMLSSYQIGLNFMSGMALFIGIFLIYNTFSMRVVERSREFGMFRTIGMTRAQIIALVLVEAGILGLIGSALGVIMGLIMSIGLAQLMTVFIGQTLSISNIPIDTLVTSISVGILATVIAAVIPAWQAGRISPMEALRARGNAKEGWLIRRGWWVGLPLFAISTILLILDPFSYAVQYQLGSMAVFGLFLGGALMIPSTIGFWDRFARPVFRRIYGSSGWIGASNIQRARLRTTLTVAALMMGVAMTVIVRGMTASFKFDLLDWIGAYIGGDLYIGSSVPLTNNFWKRIEVIPGVAAATPIRYFESQWRSPSAGDQPLTFMAVDALQYGRVTRFVFSDPGIDKDNAVSLLAQGDSVFVSSVLAERYSLKTGDSMKLRTVSGWQDFRIAGVVVDFYNQGLTVTGSWDDMKRYFKIDNATTILVRVDPGTTVSKVQNSINELYGKRNQLTLIPNNSIKEQIDTLLAQAFSMFDMLAVIAIAVASLGIINTLTMNVMERTKEIGMLRSIGMTREQVALMILAEAGLIGIVGGLLGLLFGGLLSKIFLEAMMAMSGYRLSFILPPEDVLVSLILALVISQLAALIPSMRAARIRIMEAIQYE